MNKISLVVLIKGEVKVGKSYLAASMHDSMMVDLTADSNSFPAAIGVYDDETDARYFRAKSVEELEKIIEENNATTVCIDEGKDLRDLYAKVHLEYLNAIRAERKEKPLKTIYPVTEWGAVYDEIEDLFRKYDSKKNFIVTEGMKDRYVYDKDLKQQVMTGERIADGLNILPTLADIIIHVSIVEKSATKSRAERVIRVVRSRFMDIAGDGWIDRIDNIDELIEKICASNVKFKREYFVGW